VPLHNLQSSGFYFSSEESYLILLIYKSGTECTFLPLNRLAQSDLVSFPHSLWGVVESASNLTPRGLANTFASSQEIHSLDSFLLSRRRQASKSQEESKEDPPQQFNYMIFVWNGKSASAVVKAQTLTKGYELDDLLIKAKDSVLQVLFAGGVVRQKKLQRGSVYVFDETVDKKTAAEEENPNAPSAEQILQAYETVYLLQFLIPEESLQRSLKSPIKKQKYKKFKETFVPEKVQEEAVYWQRFENVDDLIEEQPVASEKPKVPQLGLGPVKKGPPMGLGLDLQKVRAREEAENGQDS